MKRDPRKIVTVTPDVARGLGPVLERKLRQGEVVDVAGVRRRLRGRDAPQAELELQ